MLADVLTAVLIRQRCGVNRQRRGIKQIEVSGCNLIISLLKFASDEKTKQNLLALFLSVICCQMNFRTEDMAVGRVIMLILSECKQSSLKGDFWKTDFELMQIVRSSCPPVFKLN